MTDGDLPAGGTGTAGAPHADRPSIDDARAFDASSLFLHEPSEADAAQGHDDVGILFGGLWEPSDPSSRADPVDELHLAPATVLIDTAEGHLFDEAERVAHPYTHSFPAPAPARVEPLHASPKYGMSRPQVIAMAAGLVVTALGAGWALATPPPSSPVTVVASPTATLDPARMAKVDDSVGALAAAVKSEQARADSFAAPLAAMAGSSDESARLAADAARQAYIAALAAVKVPKLPTKNATNASLDQVERDLAAANSTLTAATAGFRAAITTFRQSIPAFAEIAVADNGDAAEPFRTAATEAASAAAASDPFGPTPFAAMDAWRSALAALIADQARAVAEAQSSGSGGTGTETPTEPTQPPAPVETTPPSPPPSDPGTPTDPPIVLPTP
ncbi:hypothetical protein [Microbacterium sp. 2MCAF23]|uniref:hypothetical protein n=1 Tax=Microbacterium sp. 2MCAF23 TaxID=3232985 RepID=UPI003F9E6EC1